MICARRVERGMERTLGGNSWKLTDVCQEVGWDEKREELRVIRIGHHTDHGDVP